MGHARLCNIPPHEHDGLLPRCIDALFDRNASLEKIAPKAEVFIAHDDKDAPPPEPHAAQHYYNLEISSCGIYRDEFVDLNVFRRGRETAIPIEIRWNTNLKTHEPAPLKWDLCKTRQEARSVVRHILANHQAWSEELHEQTDRRRDCSTKASKKYEPATEGSGTDRSRPTLGTLMIVLRLVRPVDPHHPAPVDVTVSRRLAFVELGGFALSNHVSLSNNSNTNNSRTNTTNKTSNRPPRTKKSAADEIDPEPVSADVRTIEEIIVRIRLKQLAQAQQKAAREKGKTFNAEESDRLAPGFGFQNNIGEGKAQTSSVDSPGKQTNKSSGDGAIHFNTSNMCRVLAQYIGGAHDPPVRSTQTLMVSCVSLEDRHARSAGRTMSLMSEDPHATLKALELEALPKVRTNKPGKPKVADGGAGAAKKEKNKKKKKASNSDADAKQQFRETIVTSSFKNIQSRRAFRGGGKVNAQRLPLLKPSSLHQKNENKEKSRTKFIDERKKKELEEEFWINYEIPGDLLHLPIDRPEGTVVEHVWVNPLDPSATTTTTTATTATTTPVEPSALDKTRAMVENDVAILKAPSSLRDQEEERDRLGDFELRDRSTPDVSWLQTGGGGDYGRVGTWEFAEEMHMREWLERLVTERAASKGDPSAQALLHEMEAEMEERERCKHEDEDEVEREGAAADAEVAEKVLQGVVHAYADERGK